MIGRHLLWPALLSAGIALAPIGDAVAQAPAEAPPAGAAPAPDEDAIRRFKDGRKLLEEGKFDEALVELRVSFEKMPSPNTELLIGHALRLSNRRAEAAATYRRVTVTAGEKVRAGEVRFQATLEEAGRLEASLRAQLAEIDIVVTGAPEGTTIAVGSDTASVQTNARGLTAKVLHEPGEITVVATTPDGRTAKQDVTAAAGSSASVLIEIPAATSEPPPPPKKTEVKADAADIWPPPVPAWIAAGVGAGGLLVFGIFGAMSSSSAGDLEECSPDCPESLRDTADSGSANQTIANVGLVIGAVGLVTAGVLWVVWPEDEKKAGALSPRLVPAGRAPAVPPRAAVMVSPAGRADFLVSF